MNGIRSSPRRCSVRKGVLRNFAKFTGKHLCQRLFFNKEKRENKKKTNPPNAIFYFKNASHQKPEH